MKVWAVLVVVLLGSTAARAQTSPPPPNCNPQPTTYRDLWCPQVKEILEARAGFRDKFQDRIRNAVSIKNENLRAFVLFAQARSRSLDFALVEDARVDKQVGAPAATPGSTSLVSKGSVPAILGFAVENGALTQTAIGTKITLRGTAVGWLDLVQNQGFIASYEDDAWLTRALRRFSYSLTLNTDNAEQPAAGAGFSLDAIRDQIRRTDQQLGGYSVRVALLDRRDPRTAANRAAIATVLDTEGVALLNSDNAFNAFFNSDEYAVKWVEETTARLSDTEHTLLAEDVERILYQQLEAVRLLMLSRVPNFDDKVSGVLFALQAFEKARTRLFEAMQKQKLLAFEYVNVRTPDASDRHTVRFIWEQQLGPRIDFTANVAGTFQSADAAAVATSSPYDMRDFQAAAELDVPLGSIQKRLAGGGGIGVPVLAIAYLAQNLSEHATVTFGGHDFALDEGMIHVLQAKVSIPVKGSGVKVPLSLSYANRTELLREKTLRGHVGLTFDMDVLTSLIK